jgi:hypothetical protein
MDSDGTIDFELIESKLKGIRSKVVFKFNGTKKTYSYRIEYLKKALKGWTPGNKGNHYISY